MRSLTISILRRIAATAHWGYVRVRIGFQALVRRFREPGFLSTVLVAILAAAAFGLSWIVLAGLRRIDWSWIEDNNPFTWLTAIAMAGLALLAAGVYAGLLSRNPAQRTIGVTLVASGAILLAWIGLHTYVNPGQDAEVRTNVAQIAVAVVAGVAVAIGSWVGWQSLQVTRERLNLDRTSRITENFTAAVEQLGATLDNGMPNVEVRLGGIYALERIAKSWFDRGDEDEYRAVIEVLTAYVRRNQNPKVNVRSRPREDIDANLDILGRRPSLQKGLEIRRPNLRGSDFTDTILTDRNLRGIDLTQARFANATFTDTVFDRAYLVGTDLDGAYLTGAHLEGANLNYARLEGADLSRAHLEGANLNYARLEGAFVSIMTLDEDDARVTAKTIEPGIEPGDPRLTVVEGTTASFKDAILRGVDLRAVHGLTVAALLEAKEVDPKLVPDHLREDYLARLHGSPDDGPSDAIAASHDSNDGRGDVAGASD